jgi:membrane-bound serine protease (ClpP class)
VPFEDLNHQGDPINMRLQPDGRRAFQGLPHELLTFSAWNRILCLVLAWYVGGLLISGRSSDAWASVVIQTPADVSGPGDQDAPPTRSKRPAVLLRISLPVTVASAAGLKSSLQQIAENAPTVVRPSDRLAVVLEFDTAGGKTGRGSELEGCQLLARYLVSAELNRVETIAYLPGGGERGARLAGHAVLIALAANQIVMGPNTSIGEAGIDEPNIDNLLREIYRNIASQRLILPIPMALAMLDKDRQLFRVQTDRGPVFVDADDLAELESQGQALETNTLVERGSLGRFTGQQLESFRLIRYQLNSRNELAAALNLVPNSLDYSPAFEGQWRAVEINLGTYIDERSVQWLMRSLGNQLARGKPPNLVVINLENINGNLDACLKLARFLIDLDENKLQTVAHLKGNVRGPAALVALCCDQLLMAADARLGGELDEIDQQQLQSESWDDLLPIVRSLARDLDRDWSLMMAMLKPDLVVNRCRHNLTGQIRLLSPEELRDFKDRDSWGVLEPLDAGSGISGPLAEQLQVARALASDGAELAAFYQLEQPPVPLQSTATDRYIERFANFLTRPGVSMLLLFMAVFLLSGEMSSPGLGVSGFFSSIFFLLFFWSHYLEGNAGWFEILLFLCGVSFILMEIFVLPGLGIFGIGGTLMIISSLILASQNFSAFRSIEDLNKLPASLLPVMGGMLGFFAALLVLRKVIPNSPFLKRMVLDSGQGRGSDWNSDRDREAVVDWSYLRGASGESITRLAPAGKARINGQVYDVITDGRMIDKGAAIVVVEAVANRVVVNSKED